MRRLVTVLALVLTSLAASALPAGAQPRAGGTLTIVQGAEPATLVSGVNTSTSHSGLRRRTARITAAKCEAPPSGRSSRSTEVMTA